jgi:signal transduction histidine kinase
MEVGVLRKYPWTTLRVRLALWNALVVVVTAVVTVVGLRQGVRWAILHEMDRILIEDFEEISLALRALPRQEFPILTDELNRKAAGHKHHGWFVELLAADREVLWSSYNTPKSRVSVSSSVPGDPTTFGQYRLLQRSVNGTASDVKTVRVGAALNFLREDMARIDAMVTLAVGVAFVTAPMVGYWLAGRATRTIGDIIQSAERLRPDRLEERLPIQGSGDELDRLASTVNGLLDRIGAYLEERRDFLANAAHELRTPLAAIRSSVEVALSADRSPDEYQELLVEIIDQGVALETLVNQLLLIAESEAERLKVKLRPIRFDEVVRRSTEMFAGLAESRDLTVRVHLAESVWISGNLNLLRQLVNNLLDNAIKYTPAGGRVSVQLEVSRQRGTTTLTVADNGIGISSADLPHVFERFFRADKSRTRVSHTAGTGLGLSICQAAAAAHGGHIHCASIPDQFTRFVVELPLDKNGHESCTAPGRLCSDAVDGAASRAP